jgi:transmembrane sensor
MDYLPRKVDAQFLVRVIKNEITPAEREFFEAWLAESDEHKADFAAVIHLWDRMGDATTPPIPDPAAAWRTLEFRLDEDPARDPVPRWRIPSPAGRTLDAAASILSRAFRPAFLYGAAAVTLAVAAFVFVRYLPTLTPKPAPATDHAPPALHTHATGKGERMSILLQDGTRVHLNGNSSIAFTDFAGGGRDVRLRGEAYFVVTSDPAHPFRVFTGETVTEVKGTEFNVHYRSNTVKVVVSRGRVKLFNPRRNAGVELRKGELASYAEATGFTTPTRVDVRRYLAWRENKLSFVRASLREVMEELSDAYDLQIVFKTDSLRGRSMTGYFEKESLDQILSSIAVAMDVKIVRNDRQVVVY